MATYPVFLPREFHGQRSLVGHSPWSCKESDMTEHTISFYIITITQGLLIPLEHKAVCKLMYYEVLKVFGKDPLKISLCQSEHVSRSVLSDFL